LALLTWPPFFVFSIVPIPPFELACLLYANGATLGTGFAIPL